MNRPVLVTPTRVDADSHRIPSGMARAADTAIIDDVSKIDCCWRSDSDVSCLHRATTVSRDGRWSGCRRARFLPDARPLPAKSGHVERRRVDRRRQTRRGAFQPVQEPVDCRELGIRLEQSLRPQRFRDLRDQLAAHAAKICQRRKDPDGRRAKRDNAQDFDDVAGGPPGEKVLGERSVGSDTRLQPRRPVR